VGYEYGNEITVAGTAAKEGSINSRKLSQERKGYHIGTVL